MAVKQLSVFVENKPCSLSGTVKHLADAKINIRAMSIADTKDFGILRLIVSDVDKAKEVLGSESLVVVTDVVAAGMKDESGSLYNILSVLGDEDINLEYMYAFTASSDMGAFVVLRVDDNEKAESVLKANGVKVLSETDMTGI